MVVSLGLRIGAFLCGIGLRLLILARCLTTEVSVFRGCGKIKIVVVWWQVMLSLMARRYRLGLLRRNVLSETKSENNVW
jgi:hypothetical protein